jgi:type IV secretion system protein VirB8
MNAVKAEDKERYLESARTWEYDRMRAAVQSRRVAWMVASGACLLAVVSVGAVALLAAQDRGALCHPG